MTLRLLLFSGILLGFSSGVRAQVFDPGYLVRSNGDTLRGELENGMWVEPPSYIRFRRTSQSESQLFKPHQLKRVSFANGRAFRYEGLPLDHAAREKVGELPYENKPDIHVDSLLAEVLVDGPVSLLRVNMFERPTHYVLLSPDRPPLDLSARKYLRQTVDHAWLLTDGNNYRGQLGVYFGQCPAAYGVAQKAPFTAKGLTDVVQAYNAACSPTKTAGRDLVALANPQRKVAFQGGVLAGVRFNRIESEATSLAGPCTDCQPHPFGGLYSELFLPSRTSAVYGELSLSTFRSQGAQFLGFGSTGRDVYNRFDYRAWLGTARLGMRYFVPLRHEQQLFMGLGAELNFIIAPTVTNVVGPSPDPALGTEYKYFYAAPTLLPNLTLGWRRQRLSLLADAQLYHNSEANGGPNGGLSGSADFAKVMFFGTNFAARLGVSYRLGRNPDVAKAGQ